MNNRQQRHAAQRVTFLVCVCVLEPDEVYKQQVFFIHFWIIINIFYCMQDGAIMHFRIKKQGLMKKVLVP